MLKQQKCILSWLWGQGISATLLSLKAQQGALLPCLFLASSGSRHSLAYRYVAPGSASNVTWLSSMSGSKFPCSPRDTGHVGWGACPTVGGPHLNQLHLWWPDVHRQPHAQAAGVRTSSSLFGEHNPTYSISYGKWFFKNNCQILISISMNLAFSTFTLVPEPL